VFVVQIIKFAADWITFEHEGKCYSINSENEFGSQELSEIAHMSFDEVKKKYSLECDNDDKESNSCSCC
jgi:hypothetical protein